MSSHSRVLSGAEREEQESESSNATKRSAADWTLLSGERLLTKQENVLMSHHSLSEGRWGQLHMTLYRFIFSTKVRVRVR